MYKQVRSCRVKRGWSKHYLDAFEVCATVEGASTKNLSRKIIGVVINELGLSRSPNDLRG